MPGPGPITSRMGWKLTGVGHRDLVDLVGVQPHFPESTFQHGRGEPLLQLERHHCASPSWRLFGAACSSFDALSRYPTDPPIRKFSPLRRRRQKRRNWDWQKPSALSIPQFAVYLPPSQDQSCDGGSMHMLKCILELTKLQFCHVFASGATLCVANP